MYVELSQGVCTIASSLASTAQCNEWSNKAFWTNFDAAAGSNGAAIKAAETTLPGIYSTVCFMIFMAFCNLCLHVLPYCKPEWIGMWKIQFISVCTMAFIGVTFFACIISGYSTVITKYGTWNAYYSSATGGSIRCSGGKDAPYYGYLFCILGIITCGLIVLFAAFPTCFGKCTTSFVAADSDDLDPSHAAYMPPKEEHVIATPII